MIRKNIGSRKEKLKREKEKLKRETAKNFLRLFPLGKLSINLFGYNGVLNNFLWGVD